MADRVGQQLGNYRLVELLGQESYAQVYLGQHVRLPLHVAIKVLHTHVTAQEAEDFQQEAETIARLMHPSIVRILDYEVQAGVPFLAMDYAPGGSLRRRCPKGTVVPLPLIISYVKQIAAALQYAHEQKVIHRDVKPENMLLGRHQEVLLSDFGLAALAHSSTSLSTQEASGTLAYMAPEQIEGHPRAASDQYALGVVVYEWLCGSRPFEGSFSEVMVQHLSMPPPLLRERVPTISGEVEQVVLKALAKDPKQRYVRIQDFALALEVASTDTSTGSTRLMLASGYTSEARLTAKHHLPAYLTPLLGREEEVVAACALLRRPDVRLVTLTGPGGIGKTRLAVQIAKELLVDFADGVSFISLAPISDPDLVIPTIAQMLEVKESGARPLLDLLKAFLQDKHVLLVLDNFEQILPAAPHLTDLLTSCPRLNILVSSRAALHVQGEHEFLVPPLAVPDHAHLPEQEALSQYAAVALFLQRAQAVTPTFQLTSSNARPIAEMCARLDGLPLAIELAAARIKILPPQALLARLGQRLEVLTSGARDTPARQQTLRNTIEWSYQLLDTEEQRLFQRLSVFASSCTLEAVAAIYTELDGDPGHVLDRVAALIDKSLLQQTELEGENPRFVMLETIREYAWEALEACEEAEATRHAHTVYYVALAEAAESASEGPQEPVWFVRLEQEHDNLRAAMGWLLERREAEMALRLGAALRWFWLESGFYHEGWNSLESALEGSEKVAMPIRAKALWAAGSLVLWLGQFERGEALCQESFALFRTIGDAEGMATAMFHQGMAAESKGDFAAARSRYEESLVLSRGVGNTNLVAWTLRAQAEVSILQGEYVRARPLLEECLALLSELDNKASTCYSLLWLALLLFSQGDLAQAYAVTEECLLLYREIGRRSAEANRLPTPEEITFYQDDTRSRSFLARRTSALLAEITFYQGDTSTARLLFEKGCAFYREVGDEAQLASTLSLLARVIAAQGDYAAARAFYVESLNRGKGMHFTLSFLDTPPALEGLAAVVVVQGEPSWAARLWGAAEAKREAYHTPLAPIYRADYERAVADARTQLGVKAFAAAWDEGRRMSLEQVLVAKGTAEKPKLIPKDPSSNLKEPMPSTFPAGLTAREIEVLRLVAKGLTNEQVAKQLTISPRTVNTHLTSIYSKIQVSSRSGATRYAIEHQMV